MKTYVVLQCNTCARTKDSRVDLTHYAPDRCTITLGCEGRLSPVGYTSNGGANPRVAPPGVTNWYPRGTVLTNTVAVQADVLFDTSTGLNKQLVIAVSDAALGFTPSDAAVLYLNLVAEQQTAKDYRQYTYRRSVQFNTVNGVEDGQAKKVLRYDITGTNPDEVQVYVNGVKRDRGVGALNFQLFDGTGTSPCPPNTVLFNTMITGTSNQVDVIVTKASATSVIQIPLQRIIHDESRVGLGAWEGIDAVTSPAIGRWSLFYCDFIDVSGSLAIDVKLRYDAGNLPYLIDVPDGPPFFVLEPSIMLTRTKLFTTVDRNRSAWIPIKSLSADTEYLMVKIVDGVRALTATQNSAQDLFPTLDVVHLTTPALVTSGLTGNIDSTQIDSEIVVGPDV
jgi:hypothetical protein